MPEIVSRSAWGARPPESITVRDPKTLKGVCVHWFGSPKSVRNHADCPVVLRAVQRAHQAGEFNDIAYNHLVCQHGVVFEGRGFGVQTGANGNRKVNEEFAAVCVMIGTGEKPSPVALVALRRAIWLWRAKGAGDAVVPHGEITGSECPGPELHAWVISRAYEITALENPYKTVESEMFRWFLWRDRGCRPEERVLASVRARVPKWWFARYLVHRGRRK